MPQALRRAPRLGRGQGSAIRTPAFCAPSRSQRPAPSLWRRTRPPSGRASPPILPEGAACSVSSEACVTGEPGRMIRSSLECMEHSARSEEARTRSVRRQGAKAFTRGRTGSLSTAFRYQFHHQREAPPAVHRAKCLCLNDPGGSRTRDLRIKSPLLYQLSYRVRCFSLWRLTPATDWRCQDCR